MDDPTPETYAEQLLRIYAGPRKELVGRRALVRPRKDAYGEDRQTGEVLAQFDFPPGTKFTHLGEPIGTVQRFPIEHPECYGWHTFPKEHFQ